MKNYKLNIVLSLLIMIGFQAEAQLANWTIGDNPAYTNFPVNESPQINGLCRISQLKFHPTNPNKMYATTAQGGMFTTNDGGENWTVCLGTDNITDGSAGFCVDYTNDQIIYMSGGDADNYNNGAGIYKSINGGNSFTLTSLTNCMAHDILQDPTNSSVFVAATNKGIYKTSDNGATWISTSDSTILFTDLKQNTATNSPILYACTIEYPCRFYRSPDFGSTWTEITGTAGLPYTTALSNYGGGRIAVTPADPNVVYFEPLAGSCTIYRSTDGGINFTLKKSEGIPFLTLYEPNDISSYGQGNYNNCIWADVNNPAKIWIQSHMQWISEDSGATWTNTFHWTQQIHTDMHQIQQSPFDSTKLWATNDGGVWLSTNGGMTWAPKSNGLYAYEIAPAASSHTNRDYLIVGTQDNGKLYRDATGFHTVGGGDDYNSKEYDYSPNGGYYYNKGDNTRTIFNFWGGTFGVGVPAPGIANLAFNRNNSEIGFATGIVNDNIFRTKNLSNNPPTWDTMFTVTSSTMALHSCPADSNRLYIISNDSKIHVCNNALSASPTFVSYNLPSGAWGFASITTIANNADIVYIAINDSVYVSHDAGVNWTNITYNLTGVGTLLAEEYYGTEELVFIAISNAVYYKKAGDLTWTNYSTNLPARKGPTSFTMFDDGSKNSVIRYASYGRGIWETSFSNLRVPKAVWTASNNKPCVGINVQFTDLSVGFTPTSWSWSFPGGNPSTSSSQNPVVSYAVPGTSYDVTLTASDGVNTSSITLNNCITTQQMITLPYSEGFEGAFPPAGLTMSSIGANFVQENSVGGFGNSSKCASFINITNGGNGYPVAGGTKASITTNQLNLASSATSSFLSFDVAYSEWYYTPDTLTVSVSSDCGATYTELYSKAGPQLSTVGYYNFSYWAPTSSQWRTDSIDISAYNGQSVKFQFKHIVRDGNNLYLDNLNISQVVPTGVAADLKLYLQGYYLSAGLMMPALMNEGVGTSLTNTDSITVELHDITSPFATVATAKTILHTNGTASLSFPGVNAGSYFLAIKHRNSIETWSTSSVSLNQTPTLYDFSDANNKSFGNNMKEVDPNEWAMFTGDVNQDGSIDIFDFLSWDADNQGFAIGYLSTDFNGDGSVDIFDFLIWDPNNQNFIGTITP